MRSLLIITAVILFSITSCQSQINNARTEIVKVFGNCELCETTIEKAADKKKISKADWNKDSKLAVITYDSKKTTLDAVLKNIALAGYDNEEFLAPDAAYNNLPGCCKYDREKKTALKLPAKDTAMIMTTHAGHDQADTTVTIKQINRLQAVFDNYFSLKDALVKTDRTAASVKGVVLLASLNAVKMETLNMDEHTVWMKLEKELKTDAKHIAESKGIESQRNYFASLSKNIYVLIKAAKPAEKIYYQNCPMYNDGKGANWLSRESTIKNPYYGSLMMSCGKTVETIQ